MKIKGAIKLEITATETERAEVDKLVEDLKNDPGLSSCKIVVKRITTSHEIHNRRRNDNKDAVVTEATAS
jgi:hypothetical protein